MTQLHDWIRENREHKGMSSQQLAEAIGVESQTIERWEEGVSAPSPEQRAHLVTYLRRRQGAASSTPDWWQDAIKLKDDMPLKDLAEHLGVSVVELSTSFRKAGVRRTVQSGSKRPGSKDSLIEKHGHLLGRMPDAAVARLAGVSVRTIASYRARHNIPGYKGPRRRPAPRGNRQSKLDDYANLLGKVPDRVVAEFTQMSLGAVRNYRIKHGIPAAGRMSPPEIEALMRKLTDGLPAPTDHDDFDEAPAPAPRRSGVVEIAEELSPSPAPTKSTRKGDATSGFAWQVSYSHEGGQDTGVIIGSSLVDALSRASHRLADERSILSVKSLGPVISS